MTDNLMKRKAQIYCERKIPAHIVKHKPKDNPSKKNPWRNGIIKEVSAEFLLMEEFEAGVEPIFFSEIKNIETFTKVKGGKNEAE